MHNRIVRPVAAGCCGGQKYKWVQKAIRKFLKKIVHQRLLDCRDEDTALAQEVPKLQIAKNWKDEVEETSLYLRCSCAFLLSIRYGLVRDRIWSR